MALLRTVVLVLAALIRGQRIRQSSLRRWRRLRMRMCVAMRRNGKRRWIRMGPLLVIARRPWRMLVLLVWRWHGRAGTGSRSVAKGSHDRPKECLWLAGGQGARSVFQRTEAVVKMLHPNASLVHSEHVSNKFSEIDTATAKIQHAYDQRKQEEKKRNSMWIKRRI